MPHPVEQALGEAVSIDPAPDWADFEKLSDDAKADLAAGFAAARVTIRGGGNPGHVMRGVALALADHFPDEHLERGMASTLRGIRNAFAETKRQRLIR